MAADAQPTEDASQTSAVWLLDAVNDERVDPLAARREVAAAAEVVLTKHPVAVLRAARVAMSWCTGPESTNCAHAEFAVLRARAEQQLGYAGHAFETSYRTLFWLARRAGGDRALEAALASSREGEIASAAVAALAVHGDALTGITVDSAARARYVSDGRRLLVAYLSHGGAPRFFPRTHALAGPWLSLLAPEDAIAGKLRRLAPWCASPAANRARLVVAPAAAL